MTEEVFPLSRLELTRGPGSMHEEEIFPSPGNRLLAAAPYIVHDLLQGQQMELNNTDDGLGIKVEAVNPRSHIPGQVVRWLARVDAYGVDGAGFLLKVRLLDDSDVGNGEQADADYAEAKVVAGLSHYNGYETYMGIQRTDSERKGSPLYDDPFSQEGIALLDVIENIWRTRGKNPDRRERKTDEGLGLPDETVEKAKEVWGMFESVHFFPRGNKDLREMHNWGDLNDIKGMPRQITPNIRFNTGFYSIVPTHYRGLPLAVSSYSREAGRGAHFKIKAQRGIASTNNSGFGVWSYGIMDFGPIPCVSRDDPYLELGTQKDSSILHRLEKLTLTLPRGETAVGEKSTVAAEIIKIEVDHIVDTGATIEIAVGADGELIWLVVETTFLEAKNGYTHLRTVRIDTLGGDGEPYNPGDLEVVNKILGMIVENSSPKEQLEDLLHIGNWDIGGTGRIHKEDLPLSPF